MAMGDDEVSEQRCSNLWQTNKTAFRVSWRALYVVRSAAGGKHAWRLRLKTCLLYWRVSAFSDRG